MVDSKFYFYLQIKINIKIYVDLTDRHEMTPEQLVNVKFGLHSFIYYKFRNKRDD